MHRALLLLALLIPLTARAETPAPQPLVLEVVTFNIRYLNQNEEGQNHWRHRKPRVAKAIQDFKADIIGLQEALRTQLDDITPALPDYTLFGVGRDDGKQRGEHSPILFRTDRFERDKEESGTFWLSDTPEQPGSTHWGNDITRICTWARLTDVKTKRSFYVFNTHWDHRSQPSRERASQLITDRIAARKHPGEPVVLLGDFNASRSNPAIQRLAKTLADSFAIANPDTPDSRTAHGFKGGTTGKKIDHIFVPKDTTVSSAAILRPQFDGAHPSDHYPVRAALQFR